MNILEYIWLDGNDPQNLRSKVRVIKNCAISLHTIPQWSFDGSSTQQADTIDSDCLLDPVAVYPSPFGENQYLVLCQVLDEYGDVHKTNTRHQLSKSMDKYGNVDMWSGMEQEYFIMENGLPLGFKDGKLPLGPQGPYYCSIGADRAFGRKIAEEHMQACLKAGLAYYGMNMEVACGQAEYQLGYRGITEKVDPLTMSDQLWISRYILMKIAESHNTYIDFNNKPIKGDINGSGCHYNFSTAKMRNNEGYQYVQELLLPALKEKHAEHIMLYGKDNDQRLTGKHETCSIDEFRYGTSDRGASIRIPVSMVVDGCGYIEDRRPGANMDPYLVSNCLLTTLGEL